MVQMYSQYLPKTISKYDLNNILTNDMLEGEILREFIDNQRKTKIAIAKDLGISKQTLFQYFKSQYLESATKEKFETYFGKKIFKKEPENARDRHIEKRNELKSKGESKNGIHVYETAPTYAGLNTVYHDEHHVPDYVLNIPQFRDCNYGTRASGDSMYPEIRNGDLLKDIPPSVEGKKPRRNLREGRSMDFETQYKKNKLV